MVAPNSKTIICLHFVNNVICKQVFPTERFSVRQLFPFHIASQGSQTGPLTLLNVPNALKLAYRCIIIDVEGFNSIETLRIPTNEVLCISNIPIKRPSKYLNASSTSILPLDLL